MRKLQKNTIVTVKAIKRHPELILSDSKKNYWIKADSFTNAIPSAQWYYWILKPKGNKFIVLKAIKTC